MVDGIMKFRFRSFIALPPSLCALAAPPMCCQMIDPDDTDEPDVFYDALRDNVQRLESFQLSSFPFLDNTVVDILDLLLPRLSSLQLRVINDRELTRDVDTGIITFEVYAEDVELPRMFGGGPSDLRKFSLWDYTFRPHNTVPNNINDKEGIPLRWRHQTLDTF